MVSIGKAIEKLKHRIALWEAFFSFDKKIEYWGTLSQLTALLDKSDSIPFKCKWKNENQFIIYSKWSMGTLQVKGLPGLIDGINLVISIEDDQTAICKIHIQQSIRIELKIIFFMALIFLVSACFAGPTFLLLSLLLFPFMIFYLGFIYRLQENTLFKAFESFINQK